MPRKSNTHVRLDKDVTELVRAQAKANCRSLAGEVNYSLRDYCAAKAELQVLEARRKGSLSNCLG